MKESDLQREIIKYLRLNRIFCWKAVSTGIGRSKGKTVFFKTGMKGMSDIIGVLPSGKFLAIEVKLEGNKPTKLQTDFINKINKQGGRAFVAYSLDDVLEKICP